MPSALANILIKVYPVGRILLMLHITIKIDAKDYFK